MDGAILGTLISIVKNLPDTAASRAEAAAELAQEYGYKFTISGTTLVVSEEDSE